MLSIHHRAVFRSPQRTRNPVERLVSTTRLASLMLMLTGAAGCVEEWKGVDGDGDGWSAADGDCWDTPDGPPGSALTGADINPDAVDAWYDGVDANCDRVDDYDPDGDGWVKEEAHIGKPTIGVAGSGDDHMGAGDCFNTPDDDFQLDPLADLSVADVAAATVYPFAPDDWYDGIDHNCDGLDDYDADADGDRSQADGDGTDCDDADNRRAGTFAELCDPEGIDEDCDTLVNGDDDSVDPETAFDAFEDVDGDTFGNPDVSDVVCDLPDGFVANGEDCDDTRFDINPDAAEICDPDDVDENCNGLADDADDPADIAYASTDEAWADTDGDNYGAGPVIQICDPGDELALNDADCDDGDAAINPAATEVCDEGIDNNCDGLADDDAPDIDLSTGIESYADTDSDSYGDADNPTRTCAVPSGFVLDDTDCNDGNSAVNPDATEVCNSIDDDCDTDIDDNDSSVSYGSSDVWWADSDRDGYGNDASTQQSCSAPANHVDPDVQPDADCDDRDGDINPGANEVCDASDTDEDCDGVADDDDSSVLSSGQSTFYEDGDTDGFGDASSSVDQCDAPSGYVTDNTDCDDGDGDINPDATEVCDSGSAVDEDCDTLIDDADPSVSAASQTLFYADTDTDTYGDPDNTDRACTAPTGFVTDNTDCDDEDEDINPGATEVCNGNVDDDCNDLADDADSGVDPSTQSTFYEDSDDDDYGLSSSTTSACVAPSGYASVDGDCDDSVASTNPGATEVCNNDADDDCDSATICALASDAVEDAAEVAWYGEDQGDYLGYRVAVVPDVTDDGVADIIISAHQSDGLAASGTTNNGAVFIADSLDGMAVGDSVSETISYQTKIVGGSNADRLGMGTSGGDFNNDGYGDLVVGAILSTAGAMDSYDNGGKSYLFLGPITASTLDISSNDQDARMGGNDDDDNMGFASAVGDIDGDAFADLAVSAPQCGESSTGTTTTDAAEGVVHVLSGATGTSWFDDALSSSTGIEFQGESVGDCAGYAVLFIDTNGSGTDELVVGAPKSVSNSRGTVYIADTSGQSGSQLLADENALLGWSNNQDVGTALGKGDFNGDGYDDLLIGAPGVTSDNGVVYMLFGNTTLGNNPASAIGTTNADAALIGPSGGGQVGQSVAGAGDLDNDGFDDIVAGAWRDDTAANNAGALWVVHGPISGSINLDASTHVQMTGASNIDALGYSVASGHDLNGDADYTDIVVGAYAAKDGATNTGAAYVLFGQGE